MSFLVLQAYLKLIQFDIYLARKDFAALYNKVRMSPLGKKAPSQDAVDRICAAVDMACIWYWKEALCLQRSSALAWSRPTSTSRCAGSKTASVIESEIPRRVNVGGVSTRGAASGASGFTTSTCADRNRLTSTAS